MTEQKWYGILEKALEGRTFLPEPAARIQWKGTEVCMDVYCDCGAQYHIDGEFCFFVKCPKCGRTFAVAPGVPLVEVPNDDADLLPMTLTAREWD